MRKIIILIMIALVLLTANATVSFAASNEKELFVVAQRAFEDGFCDVSLRYVAQLLEEFPKTDKYIEARLLEGQCYLSKKQYLKAFTVFKELVDKDTYKDTSLFWLGEAYLKAGDYAKAREQYTRVIEGFPNSLYAPQAYYSLAWSYFEKGEYDQALKSFELLTEKFPTNNLAEDSTFKVAECAYNAGEYEKAVFHFNAYLQAFPATARAYEANFNIAEAYYYLEQYARSLEFYQKAFGLTRQPRSAVAALLGQAWSFLKLDRKAEALKAFDEAKTLAAANKIPEDDILMGKAMLASSSGDYKVAAENFSEVISRFPESARVLESYLGRANAAYLANDYKSAIEDYKKTIDIAAADPQAVKSLEKARFGLAWTYLKSGELERSIESFRMVFDASDSKPVKVSALTQMADAYQEAGKIEDAIATYDRILKELPDTPSSDYVQYRLGVALLKADRIDAAILAFQALGANYPKSKYVAEAGYYLGVAYFQKKDWPEAVDILEVFLKNSQARGDLIPEARHILALAYFNLKQYLKSLAVFEDMKKNQAASSPELLSAAEIGIAKVQYETGNVKEAMTLFNEIVSRYPKSDAEEEALLWMGQHYMSKELFERAAAQYQVLLNDFPSSSRIDLARFEMARAYHAQGQFDKALEFYRLVGPDAKGDLAARAKLAVADIFSRELDPAKAIETYQNIIATSPEYKRDAFMKIALIYRRDQNYREEVAQYERALQADKGASQTTSADIQFHIGDAYEMAGDEDKAIEAYFQLPYLYEKEKQLVVRAYLRIAKLYEQKEDWDKSVAAYRKVQDMAVDESKFAAERIQWITANRGRS